MTTLDERKCFTCTWVVENISHCWESIESPEFVVNEMQESKLRLTKLHPRVILHGNCINVHLPESAMWRKLDCELALLSKDGSVLKSTLGPYFFFTLSESKPILNLSDSCCQDELTIRLRVWKFVADITEDVQCFARTRVNVERQSFLWNIPNFSDLSLKDRKTHKIKSIWNNDVLITLELIREERLIGEDRISVQLASENGETKSLLLHLKIVDNVGNATAVMKYDCLFDESSKCKLFTLPFTQMELVANKELILPNDVLSLQCDCTFSKGTVSHEVGSVIYGRNKSQPTENCNHCAAEENAELASKRILNENLKSLLHDDILSDVTVKSSDSTFRAHKSILSARSAVFKKMFSTDMKEKIKDRVEIVDLDSDTVSRMLRYVYTAEIEDLQWDSACELYRAADKYEILALRDECSARLKLNLCQGNACEVLILADAHQDEDLKAFVQDYILKHDVMNSTEWKQLMESHLKLAADTMYLQIQSKESNRILLTPSLEPNYSTTTNSTKSSDFGRNVKTNSISPGFYSRTKKAPDSKSYTNTVKISSESFGLCYNKSKDHFGFPFCETTANPGPFIFDSKIDEKLSTSRRIRKSRRSNASYVFGKSANQSIFPFTELGSDTSEASLTDPTRRETTTIPKAVTFSSNLHEKPPVSNIWQQ